MRYAVRSWKAGGAIIETVVDAPDADDAARQVSGRGVAVLAVTPAAGTTGARSAALRERFGGTSGPGAGGKFPLLLFSNELLALLRSGISVVEAIETLAEKERRGTVRQTLARILDALREGRTLSAAMEAIPEAFPSLYVATVRASERTSSLDEALGRYVAYQTQVETLRARLVSAAIYPVLLLAVGSLVILFLLGFVVPRFAHVYDDMHGELPLLSRLLLDWGVLVADRWPVLLVAAVVLAAGGLHLVRSRRCRAWAARLVWRVPALGERLLLVQLARCYRTLGMLLRGGIAIVPALDMVSGLLAVELRQRLAGAAERIREGRPISEAFESCGLGTPVAQRMLRVGERAGNMGEMMERIAAFHDEETGRWAEYATRLVGPVLMLVMGLVIGLVVVLMYLPIFQLAESIG